MVNSLRFFVRCGSSLRFFVLNSLRFFVRCGSRWRAGTQLGLTELRGWTTCTMIEPPWNHDLTSQTSFRFRWLHSQSSHILEKARNQNWHLSVIYNDKGYASKALNGLCPTRTDNFCWITSQPILTQDILILFRDQSALHDATLVRTGTLYPRLAFVPARNSKLDPDLCFHMQIGSCLKIWLNKIHQILMS